MFKDFKKEKEKGLPAQAGITLIEIVVMVALIALFSTILISDFPRIQRQYMLSRASYKLAQDLRKVQDMALSGYGFDPSDIWASPAVKGYGIYIDESANNQYKIYADTSDGKYTLNEEFETVELGDFSTGTYIKEIKIDGDAKSYASINFSPPIPIVTIRVDGSSSNQANIEIVLGLQSDDSQEKTVFVNSSGLINVK